MKEMIQKQKQGTVLPPKVESHALVCLDGSSSVLAGQDPLISSTHPCSNM